MSFITHLNLRALLRAGYLNETHRILLTAQKLPVDSSVHLHLLQTFIASNTFSEGNQIHSDINDRGYTFAARTLLQNTLINMYDKCGNLVDAWKVFDHMAELNVFSWNMIIAAYGRHGLPQVALTLFRRMQLTGVQPNQFTFANILPSCSKTGALEQGMEIHQRIMEGYTQNGLDENALEIFKQMQVAGVKPNSTTFASIVPACAQLRLLKQGMALHQRIIESGLLVDVVVVTALIDMYAKCGSIQKAHKLFDKMPQQNVVTWTAVIAGYTQNGLVEKALETFMQMQLTGIVPDSSTYSSILPACAKLGVLEQGIQIHQRIVESGFLLDVVIGNSLIDMYAKCGSIQKARQVFDKMHNANLVSWTVMVAGYAMHGCSKDALNLFDLMEHSGVKHDHVSLLCVLFACSHAGLVDHGCRYFNGMSDTYFIMPTMNHYICMVDLLGRAGFLEEALQFIIKMPIKPDAVVWMCLLGTCRSLKNTEMGEFAATLLFELGSKTSAPYVLLSNMYAELGRSHQQMQEVYVNLEKLSWEMQHAGYNPDANIGTTCFHCNKMHGVKHAVIGGSLVLFLVSTGSKMFWNRGRCFDVVECLVVWDILGRLWQYRKLSFLSALAFCDETVDLQQSTALGSLKTVSLTAQQAKINCLLLGFIGYFGLLAGRYKFRKAVEKQFVYLMFAV
ncbi:pentatricopeptide repeat-containing protein At2g13600-like [Cryptomeria japonica]|uniref:pentatricopeptide repeat-containing protein At2g13600-like n=1 Tax=Cryptomeria japonica TaxID=3369 RepID=UPI0027DA7BE3|nr:pentatricopeptide repeat-containing protein At2g13600-like [Cryptomeria japonica]